MKRPRIKKTTSELVKSTDEYFRADYYCKFKENGNPVEVYIGTKTCENIPEKIKLTAFELDTLYVSELAKKGLQIPADRITYADNKPYKFTSQNKD